MKAEPKADDGDDGHGGTLPSAAWLDSAARRILDAAWRDDGEGGGHAVPNPTTYPWLWLWDSCFHAVVWAHLGDPRGVAELTSALANQHDDGFVPHLQYGTGPFPHAALWGRSDASSITQPPMYGHAARVLLEHGFALDDDVLRRARRGLRFLLHERRRSPAGLVELCHPWESGCDDSPRWDDVVAGGWTPSAWFERKGALVAPIERSPSGSAVFNPGFALGSVGFSALVAWNARELAPLIGDAQMQTDADALTAAVAERWDASLCTWVDDGPTSAGSGRVRTLDALLPLLVCPRGEAFDQLVDPAAFGALFGPTGVHRAEPTFAASTYWRGPAWPQLTYLLWLAATSSRRPEVARSLSSSMIRGAVSSGFAEYWNADTGAGRGARPQSWTSLASAVRTR